MKHKELILLTLITLVGGYLRFNDLGKEPLWTDEVWLWNLVYDSPITQEFIPAFLIYPFHVTTEFGLRFLFALCGWLTILAIYYVVPKFKLEVAIFVSIFPLFVFWSRLSRPYVVAGFFLVLSWRWWWLMIPGILTTPISLIGLKLIKQRWYVIAGAVVLAGMFYFMREDSGRDWTFNQILNSSRWFYLPALTLILYVTNLSDIYSQRALRIKKKRKRK